MPKDHLEGLADRLLALQSRVSERTVEGTVSFREVTGQQELLAS
jgi:hypothetical protein